MLVSRPESIERLVERTVGHLQELDHGAEFGCHVHHDRECDLWEVTIFAESAASPLFPQAAAASSPVIVDVVSLAAEFDVIARVWWQSNPAGEGDDDLGCHLSVEGRFESHDIWLRIASRRPPRLRGGPHFSTHSPLFRMPRFSL